MPQVADLTRNYEGLLICPSDTQQKDIDEFVEKIKNILAKQNGEVTSTQVWGRRRLSYPIKRHRDGLYVFVEFKGASEAPGEVATLCRVSDLVVRHLITAKEEAPPVKTRAPKQTSAPSDSADDKENAKAPSEKES